MAREPVHRHIRRQALGAELVVEQRQGEPGGRERESSAGRIVHEAPRDEQHGDTGNQRQQCPGELQRMVRLVVIQRLQPLPPPQHRGKNAEGNRARIDIQAGLCD